MRFAQRPDGVRIAYEITGAGAQTILLVSPLAGTIALWGEFRERLAAHARVIAFDHRGLGDSSVAPLTTTTRALAADARAVLDDARIDRADVVGSSLGGMAATWLAADAAPRVRRLVLLSTLVHSVEVAGSLRSAARVAKLATCAVRGDRAMGRCLSDGILSDRFQADHPDEAARIARTIADAPRSRRSVLVLAAAAARHDARSALRRISAPTLALAGALDPLVRADRMSRDLSALADVTCEVVPDCGHSIALEAPAHVADRVRAFLA
ncbi:MAG TPA: alpha/beta hydrolase [Kofleriaceae bacterium]|nr:alpha/beta hydrolase [Kofleriaceae bacterium]